MLAEQTGELIRQNPYATLRGMRLSGFIAPLLLDG